MMKTKIIRLVSVVLLCLFVGGTVLTSCSEKACPAYSDTQPVKR
jgi:hypothetical protein